MIATRNVRVLALAGAGLLLLAGAALLLSRNVAPSAASATSSSPAAATEGLRAGAYDPALSAPDFALRGSDGSEVTLARYRGKAVLLSFGFTWCSTVCPTTLSTLAQARAKLGEAGDGVQVIFITVDPARDSPEKLREFTEAFDGSFIGATGTPEALATVRGNYGVTAQKHGAGRDYVMAHTSSVFLIDRAGRLRAMMPFGRDATDFVHDLTLLLAE